MDMVYEIPLPVVSVVTVVYQGEGLIERTIVSVLEQSYPNIEYIVVDGASADATPEIVYRYADRIALFVSEPDKGIYDAMNKGMAGATGDYLWFLNAGDTFYEKDTVERMMQKSVSNACRPDIIYGETALTDREGNFLRMRRLKAPRNLNWKSFKMGMLVCHQSFVVKRKIAPEYDLGYRYSSDFDWTIRCMKKAKSIRNSGMVLSNYLEEGCTTRNRKASLKERYRIMAHHYGWFGTTVLHLWFALRFWLAKRKNQL